MLSGEESDNQYRCRVEQSARHDHIVILCPSNHLNHPQSIFSHYLPGQVIACTTTSITHQTSAPQQKYAFQGSWWWGFEITGDSAVKIQPRQYQVVNSGPLHCQNYWKK